jgi:hypothetical protein
MRTQSLATFVIVVAATVATGLLGSGCGSEGEVGNSVVETATTTTTGLAAPTSIQIPIPTSTSTPTSAPSGDATTTVPLAEPVFDFPTVDALRGWSVVNDTVMGGVSTGQLAWEDAALVFTGELSMDNNGGFASVRSPLVDPTATDRWVERGGIEIEARGDGRVWTVEVRMDGENGGWISTFATSPAEFAVVELPWDTFVPVTRFLDPRNPSAALDPTRILSVAFYLIDGFEAPFRLELRSIS